MDSTSLLQSFIDYDQSTHFPLENIPFGCFKNQAGETQCCTRIGDFVINLADIFAMFDGPCFKSLSGKNIFKMNTLNEFASLGKTFRIEARETIQKLYAKANEGNKDALMAAAIPVGEVEM